MQQLLIARDSAHTEAIGACLATNRPASAIVYLEGDLGAGKTTLVRGFVHASGHQGVVKSPTYTLVEPYDEVAGTIYHFDLYRLNDPRELDDIGARDLFGAQAICLIEWPSRGGNALPQADLILRLQIQGDARQIELQAGSQLGENWLQTVSACLQAIS